jgi:RHS repeat-associated protein
MVAEDCESTAYYRARYYNSLTGRFLSRDPEAGKPAAPRTLHKYLYAGGDPVNAKDSTGRGELVEEVVEVVVHSLDTVLFGVEMRNCLADAFASEAKSISQPDAVSVSLGIGEKLDECGADALEAAVGVLVELTL